MQAALGWTGFATLAQVRSGGAAPKEASASSSGTVVRHVTYATLLALAYYVGARVGFAFQSPAVPQSVLWLPNSIVLAALLVAAPRYWPTLLLASFPAQLLVAWQSRAPLLTMSLLYVTNVTDATLGAVLWRRVVRGELRLQGLRPMLAFIVLGAAVPTLLLSFADAAITVWTRWGSDYWLAYATRARANVLTNLIFVPAAVTLFGTRRAWAMPRWHGRYLEAGLLCAGLVATASFAFARPGGSTSAGALAFLPLPFLLWAAVRFGVGMSSVALLVLAYISTWTVVHGMRIAATHPTAGIVPTLQFQLLAVTVPILCLAAVVEERQAASAALSESQRALGRSLGEVRNLGGRLLTAAEAERTRVARELHDDVGQHLAALAIALSGLRNRLPDDAALRDEVTGLQRQAMLVADGVRALSHELHPAALRYAGLVPAVRELCAQFELRETMHADLIVHGDDLHVSPEVALCAYRVTQEALRNAARHSGARGAEVTLNATADGLDLTIADNGRGFDDAIARRHGGLGLTSIDERVRLVGGSVDVATSPGHGTRISVRLPRGDPHEPPEHPTRG